jgi:hypothetical protein
MTAPDRLVPDRALLTASRWRALLFWSALGGIAFVTGIATNATRAWSVLLVNFLFWSGLGHAGVAFSAMFQVTSARWARPVKRIAEATIAFLPVSAVMLLVILAGVSAWAPWMHEPNEARRVWLNAPFFIVRQAVGFLVLSAISLAYVSASLRPDVGQLRDAGQPVWSVLARRCANNWQGLDAERQISQQRQGRLSPMLLIAYACVLSIQAFDFVMSLDPHWYSTLAGGYFFIGNLYVGVAFLAIATAWVGARAGLDDYIGPRHLYDIGRLLLGFCMLWVYLFWSQYLVIWYGDLPDEAAFVAHRTVDAPWAPLAWVVLAAAFVVPFLMLLSRELKHHAGGLSAVAGICLAGMWLERFMLVGPSLVKVDRFPIGPLEIFVTVGVGALFTLCYLAFLERVPIVPIADPLLISDVSE